MFSSALTTAMTDTLVFVAPTPVQASFISNEKTQAIVDEATAENLQGMIGSIALEYGIPSSTLYSLAWSESRLNPNTVGDGGRAFGLTQINLDYWPITKEEALDPEFNLRFAAKKIAEGKLYIWTAGNCVSYIKLFMKLPKMADIVPNTTPAIGSVAIFQYGKLKHIALVTKLEETGFFIKEANYIPALVGTRFVKWNDPRLKGFFRQP